MRYGVNRGGIMLKELLEEKNISIYRLAKDINEPYSTMNDIVNGKVDIDDCKFSVVKKIAQYLQISLDELSSIGNNSFIVNAKDLNCCGKVYVKSKQYYIKFEHKGEEYELYLCNVNEGSRFYIKDIAKYELEKNINRMQMEEFLCNI